MVSIYARSILHERLILNSEVETRKDMALSEHEKKLIGQLNFGIPAYSTPLS